MIAKLTRFFKKILIDLIFLLGIYIIIAQVFSMFFMGHYSNHYIPYKIYRSNTAYFQEVAGKLLKDSSDLGTYGSKKCKHNSYTNVTYDCQQVLSPSISFQKTLDNLGIVEVKKVMRDYRDTKIRFYFKKQQYPIKTRVNSVLRYSQNGKFGGFFRYLPYPLSNDFIYIGLSVFRINNHWDITREGEVGW